MSASAPVISKNIKQHRCKICNIIFNSIETLNAHKLDIHHDISIKEVETVLIRDALMKEYGFKCDHPQGKIKTAKRTGKSYSAWCWTRLELLFMGNFIC